MKRIYFLLFSIISLVRFGYSQEGTCSSPNSNINNFTSGVAANTATSTSLIKQTLTTTTGNNTLVTMYYSINTSATGAFGIIMSLSGVCPVGSTTNASGCVLSNGSTLTSTDVNDCNFAVRQSRDCKLYASTSDACAGVNSIPYISKVVNPSYSSTFNPVWKGLQPNKSYVMVVTFNLKTTCSIPDATISKYDTVVPTCPASAGTISVTGGTSKGSNEYDLTTNGATITISSSGSVLPSPSTVSSGSTATYGFFVFTQQPTLPFADVSPTAITALPGFKGVVSGTSISDNNLNGVSNSITGATTLWFIPAVFDKKQNGLTLDDDGDGCYAVGTPIKVNYSVVVTPPSCSTCATATCKVVVSNGTTVTAARSQSTTDIAAETNSTTHSLTNTINLKDNGTPVTICVPVTVPSDATNLGFKHAFFEPNIGCSLSDMDITRSYKLYPVGCGTPINPKITNAGGVGSGFNPEWDVVTTGATSGKILPGNYIFCYTMSIATGSLCTSVPGLVLGYYTNGTPSVPCPTDKSYITLDWKQSNPFVAWASGQTFTCTSPVQTIYKNVELATVTIGGQIQPFPGFKMSMTTDANSPTNTSALVSVNGVPYSYYGPTGTAPANVLDWGPMASGGTQDIMEPYIPKGATVTVQVCDKRTTNQTFKDTIFDYSTGNVLDKGSFTVKSGSCKTFTFTLSNPTVNWTLDGGTTGITNNNNGSVTFDPSKLSSGTHTLQYTFDNGGGCKLVADAVTFTVTGAPTITPTLSDVCQGSTTTKLTYTSTGTPTKYSIDWNAAANTAGLTDVTDVALGTSPVSVTIPGTLAAGTYTGTLTAKNASGCSSADQTVTLKVNASPSITGTTSICEGTTAIDWKPTSGVTWSSSDATIASVSTGGTLSGYKAGTVTITATDNTTQCTATKQVTVNPKPTIGGTLTVCEGSTTTLTGSGTPATTSAWVSATTTNATVSNTGVVAGVTGGNGTSEITYTDNKGCTAKTTVTVNPILFPTVTCGTSTATSVTFTWGTVTGATTYDIVYNINNTGDQTVTGHTTTTYPVSNVPAGKSVTIIVTPKGTGCFKASTIKTCTADNCPTPTITQEPTNSTKCDGTSTSFSVTATSTATLSYQWQINNGAGTPTNLTNTGVYSGANTSTLSISDVKGLNGTKYQCLVTETSSGTGCNKTSVVATLTVNPIPSFTPSVSDICEGSDPSLTYTNLTGNPNQIVFDPNLPLVSPINIPVSNSPIVISGLPIKLPVNTYSGLKVRLENTVTGCKSNDITIASFKVQATQTPSISSKGTDVSSVTFQWSDLTGLNTQTGAKEDNYLVEEFICNSCTNVGTYGTATGTLTYNTSTSKWEYLKNNLQPGDKVFIKVTPKDNSPLATPSCYGSSVFDLTAIPCDAPIISKDLADVTICEGTTTNPVSTSFDLEYNSADLNTPLTWEFLTPGGIWTPLSLTGVYSVTGTTNSSTTLSISNVNGLDGIKFRVVLKTATAGGSCNTVSKEVLLTVKPLPTMVSVADKSFCPGTLVNDPVKPKDFDFKVNQVGSPTFTWKSDLQTTGVKLEGINSTDGTKNVSEFESFTTSSPSNDAVSIVTVTPTLNQCVGLPITFKITVKPTIKPVNFAAVNDFNNVKFTWATSTVLPDYWNIDTAITNINAAQPTLAQYKNVTSPLVTGATTEFTVGGINSSKKAYIIVTPKQDATKTELFCPASDGFSGIPTPCTKPTKPADPIVNPVCEGAPITVNGVNNDLTANFQWKISTDAGVTWNNVSFTDFANTGTTNILSSQITKAYMNNALVKVVLTDKQTGQCSEESTPVKLLINVLPNVKLIQPVKTSLCIDDNDVSAFIQPIEGKSPLKVDYTLNNVLSTYQDIANLEIKFSAKSEMNYSLSVTKVIDANNCESSLTGLTTIVTVHKNPTPSFAVSDTIGCYPLKINFTDISGEKFTDVTWDFGTGTNSSKDLGTTSFTYQKQGDYTITYSVINEFGCSGEIVKVDKIHVKNSPIAVISTDRNLVNVYENVVQFSSKLSQNGTFYKWDFGDNSSFSNEPIVKHKYDPNVPGKFKVYLIVSNSTTNASCSDTAVTWIDFPEEVVYFIPNTFTPNGDEFNNTFQPIFTSGFDPQNYSFTIFDRWGQIVFESKNPTVGWDGTYGDKLLGNDTFVWKLGFKEKANDNEHYTSGHVNLVK